MSESIGKYILIDPKECPTRTELRDAIARLKKDAELLSRVHGKNDVDPRCLKTVAQFLERLYIDNRLRHSVEDEGEDLQDV